MFDEKDLEQETAVPQIEPEEVEETNANTGSDNVSQTDKLVENTLFQESEEDKFETEVLKADEEWRDLYRESRYYTGELV